MRYGFLLILSIALLQNSFALPAPLQQGEEWIDEAECLEPNSEPFMEPGFEAGFKEPELSDEYANAVNCDDNDLGFIASPDSSKQADFNIDCVIENEFNETENDWAAAARSDQWTEQQFDLGDLDW